MEHASRPDEAEDPDGTAIAAARQRIAELEEALVAAEGRADRLAAQLRNLAEHDPLTGLRNRRSTEQDLIAHLAGCLRYGAEGAFLMVGIEGLDDVISALGQTEVDDLLAHVGDSVTRRLRTTDIVGRWGSDEMAVLLPRASGMEASVVAAALVDIVGRSAIGRVPAGTLRATVGVATIEHPPASGGDGVVEEAADALVVEATLAMLAARRLGQGTHMAPADARS